MNKFILITVLIVIIVIGVFSFKSIDTTFSGPVKEFTINGSSFKYDPGSITVNKGDGVKIIFKDDNGSHNLNIDGYDISSKVLAPGKEQILEFVADKIGIFEYYCSLPGHKDDGMVGTLIVQ